MTWLDQKSLRDPLGINVQKKEAGQIAFRQNKELKFLLHIWVLMSVTFYKPVFLAWLQKENIGQKTLWGSF